ncbi:MAG: WD40/YVTN/BNR-like repeat-containing protein [Planctomycetota bacterium]
MTDRIAIFLGTDQGLFRLAPGGQPRLCGRARSSIRCIGGDCRDPAHLLAGGRSRPCLLESFDGGISWEEAPSPGGLEFWSVLFSEAGILAGTGPPAVFRREGAEWCEREALARHPSRTGWEFFPPVPPHVITLSATGGLIFAGIEVGGLLRSSDGGETWETIGAQVESDVHCIHADPGRPGHLRVATRDGLFESLDGGDTWKRHPGTEGLYLHAVVAPREEPGILYLQAREGPVLRSRNGGGWERLGEGLGRPDFGVGALDGDPFDPAVLYYGCEGEVFRSPDRGEHWERIARGLPKIRRLRVWALPKTTEQTA